MSDLDDRRDERRSLVVAPVTLLYTLKVARALDFETKRVYELAFRSPGHTNATATLRIVLVDANDNEPVFVERDYSFRVGENEARTCVGLVRALDADSGANARVRYSIVSESVRVFRVSDADATRLVEVVAAQAETPTPPPPRVQMLRGLHVRASTGEICLGDEALDRECAAKYSFLVLASDDDAMDDSGVQQLPNSLNSSRLARVVIDVLDVNDNAPIFYEQLEDDTSGG